MSIHNTAVSATKRMRSLVLLIALLFAFTYCQAAFQQPVKWTFSLVQKGEREADLVFTAKMDKDWHIYSQHTPDGGPFPMTFSFTPDKGYSLIGKVSEPKPFDEIDETFGVHVLFFSGEAKFVQKVKLNDEREG